MQQDASVREAIHSKQKIELKQGSLLAQLWETNLEVFRRDRLALAGLIIFIFFIIAAISK